MKSSVKLKAAKPRRAVRGPAASVAGLMRIKSILVPLDFSPSSKKALDYAVDLARQFNARGIAKVELGLGKGKKLYDKREAITERDTKREVDRAIKRARQGD